jgi:phosphoribosyl 1,2-cyclic phosphate phosphodiesterase
MDAPLPTYALAETCQEIRERFSYLFKETQRGGGKARIDLRAVGDQAFRIGEAEIQPIPLMHGSQMSLGYRFGAFAYLTDCSSIPEESFKLLQGLEVVAIDALRKRPHPTHFSLDEAVAAVRRIKPKRAFFTHICHDLSHTELVSYAQSVSDAEIEFMPAFDGQRLVF